MLKKICLMILVLFYAVGISSFLVNFQSAEDFSLSRSEVKESSTNVQKDDVIIPDAEKVSLPTASFPGAGTQANPYILSTAEHLAYLSENYSRASGPKYFELGADIILNDGYFEDDGTYHDGGDGVLYEWAGINAYYFQNDHFDGKGHSIIGMYHNPLILKGSRSGHAPAYFENCEFKNFSVKNAYVYLSGSERFGIIFSGDLRNSVFENISCYGKLVVTGSSSGTEIGGILGYVINNSTIKNCSNYADVVASNGYIGGVAGYTANGVVVSQCVNGGKIDGGHIGGIVSRVGKDCVVENCINEGEIGGENKQYVGGIADFVLDGGTISNCENKGIVLGRDRIGGIASQMSGGSEGSLTKITNCKNTGKVQNPDSGSYTAGIVGEVSSSSGSYTGAFIENCINYSEINKGGAGIIGNARCCSIKNCINYGNVIGTGCAGIAKTFYGNGEINGCVNYGHIKGTSRAGGIVGYFSANVGKGPIINCVNKGCIEASAQAGGIIGYQLSGGCEIYSCVNEGTIIAQSSVGGIAGYLDNQFKNNNGSQWEDVKKNYGPKIKIFNTRNSGTVKGADASGFVGKFEIYAVSYFQGCVNEGDIISSSKGYGFCTSSSDIEFVNCCNEGKVSGTIVYGISSTIKSKSIKNCCNIGVLNATSGNNYAYGLSPSKYALQNSISFCKANGTTQKQYYGTDFSGFYCNRLTGEIGLRRLNSRGLFDAVANETLLQNSGFTKMA